MISKLFMILSKFVTVGNIEGCETANKLSIKQLPAGKAMRGYVRLITGF